MVARMWCIFSIVSTYLVHHGYCAAAYAFLRSTGQLCEEELASIQNRRSMIFVVVTLGKYSNSNLIASTKYKKTSGSAIAEGPRDVLVSRNSATTKYRYRVALFA